MRLLSIIKKRSGREFIKGKDVRSFKYVYEGLDITYHRQYIPKVRFVCRDTVIREGKVQRYIGDTQTDVNPDLSVNYRAITMLSGRQKQVNNKKPQGEDRRKRCENRVLSFGVSKSKAYHKAKHKKQTIF